VRQQSWIETGILFASGAGFGHRQIHWIKATGDAPVGGGRLQPSQAVFAALRLVRRLRPHALGVVAEVVVEERQLSRKRRAVPEFSFPLGGRTTYVVGLGVLTNAAVDQIGKFGCPQRIDVMHSAGG